MKTLKNGTRWVDTDGNVIHAHGGHMLFFQGQYFWYGENRTEGNYVSCYRSTNLMDWEFCRNILTVDSKTESIRMRTHLPLRNSKGDKVNLERPKILYNGKTKKFVLWAHYENGIDYTAAGCALATCDTPDGDFVYHGFFNPYGYMSRDCTLFQEDDGTAYFISASRDNADLHVYRLADDYMNIAAHIHRLWQGEYREAPAVMKREGKYFMLSSYCTGWHPNQCQWASADAMEGRWSSLLDIEDETTYQSQPAFILPLKGDTDTIYLYFGDRWDAQVYDNSSYIVLPITVDRNGVPTLEYVEQFAIDEKKGSYIAK